MDKKNKKNRSELNTALRENLLRRKAALKTDKDDSSLDKKPKPERETREE